MHIAVAILRISEGLDYGTAVEEAEEQKKLLSPSIRGNQSFSQLSQGMTLQNFFSPACRKKNCFPKKDMVI